MDERDPRGPGPLGGPAPGPPPPAAPWTLENLPPPPPPGEPEPPERPDGAPRWPWWHGLVILPITVSVLILTAGPIVLLARAALGVAPGEQALGLTLLENVLTGLVFVGCAVGFAALTTRPRPSHFGLRPTAVWPAIGFCVLGIAAFWAFSGLYQWIYSEEVKQDTLEKLGAGRGLFGLVSAGVMVVVLAPLTEELFFRGFLYRALRSRLSIPVAALVAGPLFGAMHLSTGVAATLPLAVLGVVFCLIVERTGSLYPVIVLHAVVNTIAYSVSPDAPEGSATVALPLLAAMIAGCLIAGQIGRGRGTPTVVETAPAPG